MGRLAWKTLRHHIAGAVGTFAVVALAVALLTAVGVLGESGVRGGVAADRYATADVIVTTARPSGPLAALGAVTPAPLSREVAAQIAAVDGVAEIATEINVALLDGGGEPVTAHDGALVELAGAPLAGRMPQSANEVAVESGTGHALGDEVTLSRGAVPGQYTVVGIHDRATTGTRAGHIYLTTAEIARLWPAATEQTSIVAVRAAPGVSAGQLADQIEAQVDGVDAATGRARGGIEFTDSGQAAGTLGMLVVSFAGTALVVVALVVTSTSSLAVRQRHRQIALLRALGATPAQIRSLVTREILGIGALGALVGALPGLLSAPFLRSFLIRVGFLPTDFELARSPLPALVAAIAVLCACLVAARLAARAPSRTAPVAALRDSAVEEPGIGKVRSVCAFGCAALALLALAGQFLLPGAVGSAASASSALLLVVALALAGPPIVHRLVVWAAGRPSAARGSSRTLAFANSRGFSRRLTAAVVPLTLAIVLGVVQLTSTAVLTQAGTRELADALAGTTVVTSGAGIAPGVVSQYAGASGVDAATTLTHAQLYLGERDAELGSLANLMWEPVGLLVVDPATVGGLLDPGLRDGSLADLSRPGTVAISTDTQIEQDFAGVGGRISARFADGTTEWLEIVAIYERGTGLGPVLTGEATWRPHAADDLVDAVLVDGVFPSLVDLDLTDAGLSVQSAAAYADLGVGAQEPVQRVSAAMLLALVAFVVLAALNSLVMATLARRPEFGFYHLLGATRRQVVRVAFAEAGIAAALAVGLGAVITIPVAVLVSLGALGALPPIEIGVAFLVLAGTVAAVAVAGIAGATVAATRRRGRSIRRP